MQDFYKVDTSVDIKEFDPHEHFKFLCASHKVVLSDYAIIRYKFGWSEFISQFISELKVCPIRLTEVIDSHGQLDIRFEMLKKRNEVLAWRLIQY